MTATILVDPVIGSLLVPTGNYSEKMVKNNQGSFLFDILGNLYLFLSLSLLF